MAKRPKPQRDGLVQELADLPNHSTNQLKARWRQITGQEPPTRISQGLLLRAVAYHRQEQVLGGLKPATIRLLERAASDQATGKATCLPPNFKTGTRLLREWHGQTHEVILQENGVTYGGQHWRSLSEVARAITGARWSGPRFFGLKGKELRHAAR